MPELLRDQLPSPDLYSSHLDNNEQAVRDRANEVVVGAGPIVATQDNEAIAYDVAQAIKPDIDEVVLLEDQKKLHNPLENASTVEINGEMRLTGLTPFAEETTLVAAKADLERNAKYASEIATKQHLGGAVLELMLSKQKVANMHLR